MRTPRLALLPASLAAAVIVLSFGSLSAQENPQPAAPVDARAVADAPAAPAPRTDEAPGDEGKRTWIAEETRVPILGDVPLVGRLFNVLSIRRAPVNGAQPEVDDDRKTNEEPARRQAPEKNELVRIVVAARDLANRDMIDSQDVHYEDWPKDRIPEGVIFKKETVHGLLTSRRIYRGEPVLDTKLVDERESTPPIPDGFRVVAVKLSDTAAPNIVLPGDKVDVLLYLHKGEEVKTSQVRTLLTNVRVYNVNGLWDEAIVEHGRPVDVDTVSMLVTVKQAEMLLLAAELGSIRLTLRGHQEADNDWQTSTDVTSLLGGFNDLPPIPKNYGVVPLKFDVTRIPRVLLPGDRVDIEFFPSEAAESVYVGPRTVLSRVRVYDVSDETERVVEDGREIGTRTVTMLATPQELTKLLLAAEAGSIGLSFGTESDRAARAEAAERRALEAENGQLKLQLELKEKHLAQTRALLQTVAELQARQAAELTALKESSKPMTFEQWLKAQTSDEQESAPSRSAESDAPAPAEEEPQRR